MNTRFAISFIAALGVAAVSLPGCASQPNPGMICPAIAIVAPPPMIYPASGAVNVPDGKFPLVLAFNPGDPIELLQGSNVVAPSLQPTPVPSPLPAPTATPNGFAPSPSGFVAYSIPALQPKTIYTLSETFGSQACLPSSQTIGTFTTR